MLRLLRLPDRARGSPLSAHVEAWTRRWRSRASLAYDVPFSDHSARFHFVQAELASELETVFSLRTDSEISDYLESFADDYARSLGLDFGAGTSSGTAALTFSLLALGLEPGDEVLVPCYTFVATALAVCAAGGTPVFVDASSSGPHLDLDDAARKAGPRTKGLIEAHLFGGMADPAPLVDFCRARGLFFLEDACQAHGVRWDGRLAGAFGDAAAFSFNQTKLLSGLGNGGIMVTSDTELLRKARLLRDPQSREPFILRSRRTPGYLDPVQAACVRVQMGALDRLLQRHRSLAACYLSGLAGLPLRLPEEGGALRRTWHWFVIRTSRRDALRTFLRERGIDSRVGFFEPLAGLDAFRGIAGAGGRYPEAERLWRESLALPIGPHMEEQGARRVSAAVRDFFALRSPS